MVLRMKSEGVAALAIGFLFGAIVSFIVTSEVSEKNFRREAVKAGVARWVNEEDGSPLFEWIVP